MTLRKIDFRFTVPVAITLHIVSYGARGVGGAVL